jgi:hypothetical protein
LIVLKGFISAWMLANRASSSPKKGWPPAETGG